MLQNTDGELDKGRHIEH